MVDKMQLSASYKKAVIPRIVEGIFLNFNERTYNNALAEIVRNAGLDSSIPDAVAIYYKGNYYAPFKMENTPFKVVKMTESHRQFPRFNHLISLWNGYKELTAVATNYLSNGLAMCVTTECMCEVFPDFILEIINEIHRQTALTPNAPTNMHQRSTFNPKFVTFKKRNEQVVKDLKKQMVINILTPGTQNAIDPV